MLLHSSENYGFSDENGIIAIFSLFCLFLSVPVMLLKEKACRKVWTGSKVYCSVHNYCSVFILLNYLIYFFFLSFFFIFFVFFLSNSAVRSNHTVSIDALSHTYLSFIPLICTQRSYQILCQNTVRNIIHTLANKAKLFLAELMIPGALEL